MYLELKRFVMKPDSGLELAKAFANRNLVENQPGFVRIDTGLSVQPTKEEVCVMIYWEDKEAFLNWKRSPEHLNSHKNRKKNEAMLEVNSTHFEIINKDI